MPWISKKSIRETRRLFTEAGMPVFDDVKNALRAIASVSRYYGKCYLLHHNE